MKKVVFNLQKIQILVGGFFLSIFLIAVLIQISTRYLGISATWSEEIAMYSFIWAVFLCSGAMVLEKKHFAFTSFSDSMKNEKSKAILSILISLIILFFSILLLYYGIIISKKFWNYTWVNIVQFKRGPTWICVPICGLTSSIYCIYNIIEDIKLIAKREGK